MFKITVIKYKEPKAGKFNLKLPKVPKYKYKIDEIMRLTTGVFFIYLLCAYVYFKLFINLVSQLDTIKNIKPSYSYPATL